MPTVILGSQSPRRKELLAKAGYKFDIILPEVDETIPATVTAWEAPTYLAHLKAKKVYEVIPKDTVILTADTLVICDDQIFGKPIDLFGAKQMLQALSGKVHNVVTGICLKSAHKTITTSSSVAVHFKELSEQEIQYYIENFEVLDKAGAYAIQEWIGLIGIEKIEGDYYSVMGLPIATVYSILFNEFGIQPFLTNDVIV